MINNIESDATKLWEELGGYIPANPVKLANSFRIDVCSAELKDGLVGGIVKDNETATILDKICDKRKHLWADDGDVYYLLR